VGGRLFDVKASLTLLPDTSAFDTRLAQPGADITQLLRGQLIAQTNDKAKTPQTTAPSTNAKTDDSKKAPTTPPGSNKPLSVNEDPAMIGKRNINKGIIAKMSGSTEKEVKLGRELAAEVERLLGEAQRIDEEEDELYGPGKRGDELPEELRNPETRLARIRTTYSFSAFRLISDTNARPL